MPFYVAGVPLYLFLDYTQWCSYSLQRQNAGLSLSSVCSVPVHSLHHTTITANHGHVKLVAKNWSITYSKTCLYGIHPYTSLHHVVMTETESEGNP